MGDLLSLGAWLEIVFLFVLQAFAAKVTAKGGRANHCVGLGSTEQT